MFFWGPIVRLAHIPRYFLNFRGTSTTLISVSREIICCTRDRVTPGKFQVGRCVETGETNWKQE